MQAEKKKKALEKASTLAMRRLKERGTDDLRQHYDEFKHWKGTIYAKRVTQFENSKICEEKICDEALLSAMLLLLKCFFPQSGFDRVSDVFCNFMSYDDSDELPDGMEEHVDGEPYGQTVVIIGYTDAGFTGGELVQIEGGIERVVARKPGDAVCFGGHKIPHRVRRVTQGTRLSFGYFFLSDGLKLQVIDTRAMH